MSLFAGLGSIFQNPTSDNRLYSATTDYPLKRFLQERSFLLFEFSKLNESITHILPFFENISIAEDQRANYAVYDLIGRAGNLYGYTGAKSRNFKLTFRMNVKHIQHIFKTEGMFLTDFTINTSENNKEKLRERFTKPPEQVKGYDGTDSKVNNFSEKAATDYMALVKEDPNVNQAGINAAKDTEQQKRAEAQAAYDNGNFLSNIFTRNPSLVQSKFFTELGRQNPYSRTINLVLSWINLIRTSVLNDSTNSTYGPPIIRINHGLLYNNVPCICTNYSIRESPNTSYDVVNLFPHVVEVSMSLEEVRLSEGKYAPGGRGDTLGESLAGWNDFLQHKTMDPYTGVWSK